MTIDELKCLVTPEGFEEAFHSRTRHTRTYQEAFEQLNEEYKQAIGKYRYSDYNSFMAARNERRARRKNPKIVKQ